MVFEWDKFGLENFEMRDVCVFMGLVHFWFRVKGDTSCLPAFQEGICPAA
jgi:hypothetical protein